MSLRSIFESIVGMPTASDGRVTSRQGRPIRERRRSRITATTEGTSAMQDADRWLRVTLWEPAPVAFERAPEHSRPRLRRVMPADILVRDGPDRPSLLRRLDQLS